MSGPPPGRAPPSGTPLLELVGVGKWFGPVHALRGADFALAAGEVHALLGENGAGKTTLMRIACGLERPDAGEVRVDGVPRALRSPREARRLGLGMVHQHFTAIPALTVAENVALAGGWRLRPAALRARTRELAERVGLPLDPDERAGRLGVALKQRLEVVKALAADARVLLLDEPTAVLAPAESAALLRVARAFAAGGGAVALVTHRLDEALGVADRITVLRGGEVVAAGPAARWTAPEVARAMIGDLGDVTLMPGAGEAEGPEAFGSPMGSLPRSSSGPSGPGACPERSRRAAVGVTTSGPIAPLVRFDSLDVPRESGYGIALRDGALVVWAGEVVGIAAVEGNGQRELLRAVAGRVAPLRGRLEVAAPLAFIPEDRTTEGLIPALSLTENVVLGSGADAPWVRRGLVDWRAARAHTAALLREYAVRAPAPEAPAAALSGGNQQRLVIARELARSPRVVVAESPTRGLDLAATRAVHDRLRAAAAGGAAVLFHSSDLDEVLALADRVIVVARGAVLAPPPGAARDAIGAMMVGGARGG